MASAPQTWRRALVLSAVTVALQRACSPGSGWDFRWSLHSSPSQQITGSQGDTEPRTHLKKSPRLLPISWKLTSVSKTQAGECVRLALPSALLSLHLRTHPTPQPAFTVVLRHPWAPRPWLSDVALWVPAPADAGRVGREFWVRLVPVFSPDDSPPALAFSSHHYVILTLG